MGAPGSSLSFPRLTWVSCECGCGWEGEDEVTQWLVEEAVRVSASRLADREVAVAAEDSSRHDRLTEMALRALRGGR